MATAKKTTAKPAARAVAKAPAKRAGKAGKTPAKPAKPARSTKPAKPAKAGKAPAKAGKAPAKSAKSAKSAKATKAAAPTRKAPAKSAKPAKPPAKASKAPAKASKAPAKASKAPATTARPTKSATSRTTTPATKASTPLHMSSAKPADTTIELPKPKFNKDGLGYTKDFDVAFVKQQYDALQAERVRLTGQALRLEAEAHSLVEEAEMGDVKFDDEGGEGDTMNVERERDLALSAQAREAIEEIDAALLRIAAGTYGYSVVSGRLIPRERLEALPWSSVLVEEKVGGIGRR